MTATAINLAVMILIAAVRLIALPTTTAATITWSFPQNSGDFRQGY